MKTVKCVLTENGYEPAYPEELAAFEKVENLLDKLTEEQEEEFWDKLGCGNKYAAEFLGVSVEEIKAWLSMDD